MTTQQQDPFSNRQSQPGVINKAGVKELKTEEQRLQDNIAQLSAQELERLNKRKPRPAQMKRKILADKLRADPTAMSLMQMAAASYTQEIDRYNVQFRTTNI